MLAQGEQSPITFLYPSRNLGGAQLLFVRVANALARRGNRSVSVVDFVDGFLASQVAGHSAVTVLPYVDAPVQIASDRTIVAPLSMLADLHQFVSMEAGVRLLLWSIHPDNISHVMDGMGRRFLWGGNAARRSIRRLAVRGSIVYMDLANYSAVRGVAGDIGEARYLPIPFEVPTVTPRRRPLPMQRIHIAWLGRIAADKIFAIQKIADEVARAAQHRSVALHIIGDGPLLPECAEYLRHRGVDHQLPGVLVGDALSDYLSQHIDLGIAMGTSCLEIAARGIPALLIDYSLRPFPSTIRYNWLHETASFTLGDRVGETGDRKHSFEDVLDQLQCEPGLGTLAQRYVLEHHSLEHVTTALNTYAAAAPRLDRAELSRLRWSIGRGPYDLLLTAAWRSYRTVRSAARGH